MNEPSIRLRSINDLLSETFYVPAYQRGYRWTEQQVFDLLNDLQEFWFKSDNADRSTFYCLQPIVVKKRPGGLWELVDGQQRLITIYLVLNFLRPLLAQIRKSPFELTFESRGASTETFLKSLDPNRRLESIDNYHISNALDAIERWFNSRDGNYRLGLLQSLLNDDQAGKNVKVIWYEIPEQANSVDAFTRLNVGKIPLTNAELIRALFLRWGNFDAGAATVQQLRIAQEWDAIEKRLQSDDFWYFLVGGRDELANRIELVFDLSAREAAGKHSVVDDPYHVFHFFNSRLDEAGTDAESEWLRVKQHFMTLEEWFDDRVLYHLVGYLVQLGDDILSIRKTAQDKQKSVFERALKRRIFSKLVAVEYPSEATRQQLATILAAFVDEMEYGQNSAAIRSVLLLFNISTLLTNEGSNLRFPFDSFGKASWDIEHIRSVASDKPQRTDDRRQWLGNFRGYLTETGERPDLLSRILDLLDSQRIDGPEFDILYIDLLGHFHENEDTDAANGIANLALLDAATNRSYKNAVFPVKRRTILRLDQAGTFVPLCTRNVFLKCYSQVVTNMMFWSADDSNDYRKAIVEELTGFFFDQIGEWA